MSAWTLSHLEVHLDIRGRDVGNVYSRADPCGRPGHSMSAWTLYIGLETLFFGGEL